MVRFRFDSKAPIILVHADVVGPKGFFTIRMLLDTGASYTMMHPDVLMRIGCEATSPRKQRITTASGIEVVSFVTIPEIRSLGQNVTNVEIAVHDLPPSLPAEGLLGLNFLRYFDVHLNFPQGTLEIT